MRDGLFEYGDRVVIAATDEKGVVNIDQLNEADKVEVQLESGAVNQYDADELEYDLDYQPDTGE
jgi:hypothetical protein